MKTSDKAQPRREVWRDVIGRQELSGQSVRGFCREHGINLNTFYKWKNKLSEAGPSKGSGTRFALVEMSGAQGNSAFGIEVICASGDRVLIGAGVDAATLRTVLSVLRDRA